MSNKFITLLQHIGQDIEKGFEIAKPYIQPAEALLAFIPGGAVAVPVINAVFTVEQNFAAVGKQSGSGNAKLAQVLQILEPYLKLALPADVDPKAYVNAIVAFLNAIPAFGVPPTPPAAPTA